MSNYFFGIFLVILLSFFYIYYQKCNRRNLPPGPLPLPLIGNVIELALTTGHPYEALQKLSKKYGNIFSIVIGSVQTVVVSGNEAVRSLLKNPEFDNRINDDWILDRCYGKEIGLFFSTDGYWKDVRKLTTRIQNEVGFGRTGIMDSLITEEFEQFIQILKDQVAKDESVLVDNMFHAPMANIIWSLITGHRFEINDPQYLKLMTAAVKFVKAGQVGGCNALAAFPFLSKIAPGLTGFKDLHLASATLLSYFEEVVREHQERETFKYDPTDFIDVWLSEIDKNKNTCTNGIYTDENLVCTINDLFVAGFETSGNTMAFALRLMVQYPQVQLKVRKEIFDVVGKHHIVTYEDRQKLPYTNATMLEIFRITSVVPIAPRRAVRTVNLNQYKILKGTQILVNIYSVNMDKSLWGDPHNFRPERFMSGDGNIINSEKLMSFGIGNRNCIGEASAKKSIFIAFSNLIRNFKFECDEKYGLPLSENIPGLSSAPKPFRIKIKIS